MYFGGSVKTHLCCFIGNIDMSSTLPRNNSCCTEPSSVIITAYGGINEGHGAPISNPVDTLISWIYKDLDTGILWFWSVEDQAWA